DDIQLLYTNSTQIITAYNAPSMFQPMLSTLSNPNLAANNGEFPLQGDPTDPTTFYAYQPMWPDYYTFPASTTFLQPANAPVIAYAFPGSPANRCFNTAWIAGTVAVPNACPAGQFSGIPNGYRDGETFQASIVKLQYQKNIGSNAYLRLFGYTFYS